MTSIINPKIDLFLYQKRDTWGGDKKEILQNRINFSKNFPKQIALSFNKETTNSTEYLRLLDARTLVDAEIEGYEESYYAVLLNDVYVLFYSCFVKDAIAPQPIACFQSLKQLAQTRKDYADLGKTWIFSGCATDEDPEAIARAIYHEAGLSGGWNQHRKGKFLGVPVFEFGKPPQTIKHFEPKDSHVLILIFPDPELQLKLDSFSRLLLQLFCFRKKIFWSYSKTRLFKEQLKGVFGTSRETIVTVNKISNAAQPLSTQQFKQLQRILNESIDFLYEYANTLSYLEMHLQSIEVNLFNYEKCLSKIAEKALGIGDSNLFFLAEFSTLVQQTYCKQIEKDRNSLTPGLRVLENAIAMIRGVVEIEQAELNRRREIREEQRDRREKQRDRHLTIAIAAVGFGVGVGTIVASSSTHFQIGDPITFPYAFPVVVTLSLSCGILAAAIAAWCTHLWLNWRDRHP